MLETDRVVQHDDAQRAKRRLQPHAQFRQRCAGRQRRGRGGKPPRRVRGRGRCSLQQAAALLEFVTDGSWTKRFHGGLASHAGIMAAELAQRGMTAPPAAIEGKFGYLRAYSGDPLPTALAVGHGDNLAILHAAIKYYPCNYYI